MLQLVMKNNFSQYRAVSHIYNALTQVIRIVFLKGKPTNKKFLWRCSEVPDYNLCELNGLALIGALFPNICLITLGDTVLGSYAENKAVGLLYISAASDELFISVLPNTHVCSFVLYREIQACSSILLRALSNLNMLKKSNMGFSRGVVSVVVAQRHKNRRPPTEKHDEHDQLTVQDEHRWTIFSTRALVDFCPRPRI